MATKRIKKPKSHKPKARTTTPERTPAPARSKAAAPTAGNTTTAPATPKAPRAESKMAAMTKLAGREGGASKEEIIEALVGLGSTPEKARAYLQAYTGRLQTAREHDFGYYRFFLKDGRVHLITQAVYDAAPETTATQGT